MNKSSAALVDPLHYRWGNWLSPPDPTGELRSFLISALTMTSLVVLGVIFRDPIFGPLRPSHLGRDDGLAPFLFWLGTFIVAASAAVSSVGTTHFRIDRVEVNAAEIIIMFSHIPDPLGRYVTETGHFDWRAVGRIVENDEDDGEGGHAYSIKVELMGRLRTGGASEIDLSMDGEQEMHRAFRKIQALRG